MLSLQVAQLNQRDKNHLNLKTTISLEISHMKNDQKIYLNIIHYHAKKEIVNNFPQFFHQELEKIASQLHSIDFSEVDKVS